MALRDGDLGARLGVRLAMLGSKVREESLARTTPALTKQAVQIANTLAAQQADTLATGLVEWLEANASRSPLDPRVAGIIDFVTKGTKWLFQNVLGTAIGFGLGGALTAVLEPYFSDMAQSAWQNNPVRPLSPGELALAVLRGEVDQGEAGLEAAKSGISEPNFDTLIRNTGNPPGPADLLQLWRRGVIDDQRLEQGVRQSRIRNEWLPEIRALGIIPMSPEEALEAFLEGQVDEATARRLYEMTGGDPEQFTIRYNTRGQAPTPAQSIELLNRGIIPERGTGPDATSYEQSFLEGPWRNKWLESFLALREYLPPPRTVVTLVRNGAITKEVATDLLQKQGLRPELAAAYVASATTEKLATDRELTKSDILGLYRIRAINQGEAVDMLGGLGFDQQEATYLVLIEDFRRAARFQESAITRIRNRFINWRISRDEASITLDQLNVPSGQRATLLTEWEAEREATVVRLTAAQVRQAVRRELLTPDEGFARLLEMGYDQRDAEIYLQLTG